MPVDPDDAPELPAVGEAVGFWVQGASDEQRDAHYRAQRWAHVLPWQIDRLYDARMRSLDAHDRVLAAGHYPDDARWPFMEMDAEIHFALVAARQLLRALKAFDGNDRLPAGLTSAQVRDVRDGLEHWDEPGGSRAARNLAKQGANPMSHRWSLAGPGILGDVVPDSVLRTWATDVYAELDRWDPFDGWRT